MTSENKIIDKGVNNEENVLTYSFVKKFNLNISSTKYQYNVHTVDDETCLDLITFVHSIPWQYIWLYMTEKEFEDVKKTAHTVNVDKVSLKIVNLGNRTPFITSSRVVS